MRRLIPDFDPFEPRGLPLAVGRSVIALAELTELLFSSDRVLFLSGPSAGSGGLCQGPNALSLWCVAGSLSRPDPVGRVLAVLVLVAVAAGYRPRWTCVPHWYVAFSMGVDLTVVNGGDRVAAIVTGLLIPVCLTDRRVWQWRAPAEPLPAAWRGASGAALVVLRLQIILIYADAALSKLSNPAWRQGTALRALANDPEFGFPLAARPLVREVLGPAWIAGPLTWSVMAIELLIALSMLTPVRVRRTGLAASVCLHSAIILGMGLVSFGLIMIGTLAVSCAGGRPWAPAPAPAEPAAADSDDTPALAPAASASGSPVPARPGPGH